MTKVVNIKTTKEKYIYCARPTIYGNSFIIGVDGNRDEVCDKYKVEFDNKINNDKDFKRKILKLKDKNIGCFCKPLRCHLDTIANYLNNLESK